MDHVTPEDFGAFGDGVLGNHSLGHDDTSALQAAIDFCVLHGFRLMLSPNRIYKTVDMLQIGSGSAMATFYGGVLGASSIDQSVSAAIYATATDQPAINIQGARNVYLEDWYVTGDNGAPVTGGLDVDNKPDASLYVSAGLSNTRWAPHAGIVIDALSGSDPGTGYAGKTYGQYTSIGVHLHRCVVRGFVVGIMNWGTPGNGDNVTYERCDIYSTCVAIAICATQCRANTIQQSNIEFCHTCLDSNTYGGQNGSAPTIIGGEWVCFYRAFNVNTNFAPLNVNGLYTESMKSLGVVAGPLAAVFVGTFVFLGGVGASSNPLVHGTISTPCTKFIGCAFVRENQNFLNFVSQTQTQTVFEGCTFICNGSPTADFKVNERIQAGGTFGRTILRECNVGTDGTIGNPFANECPSFYSTGSVARPGQAMRSLFTDVGTANGYLFDGEMFLRKGFTDSAVALSASSYAWTGDTVVFTAGTAGEFLVDDSLYWKLSVRSSANPDTPTAYNGLVDSNVIALKVTNVSGTTITAVAMGDYQQLDRTDAPSVVYVAHLDWAPMRAFTGTWTTASSTMVVGGISNALVVGQFVRAAAGLPTIIRISAVVDAVTYTLSKLPTANRTSEPIFCSKLVGI